MLRSIVAVVVTYIVMFILILAAFAALMFGLGPDRLLLPGSWKGGLLITIAAPAITVIVGLFGGWMCAKIGRSRTPVIVLACLVLVLGLVSAVVTLQKPFPSDPRDPGLTTAQFMEKGREPTWVAVSNPILGAGAVLIGGLFMAVPRKRR